MKFGMGFGVSVYRLALVSFGSLFVLGACAAATSGQSDTINTAVAGTVQAMITIPPITNTQSPSQTPSPSSTPIPTETQTPTPPPPMVSVSSATNCRTGPGSNYRLVLSLRPGEVAEVAAKSTVQDYWYIAHPEKPDEFCWLWGEYATVDGDITTLPVFTPEPSPTPSIGFTVYHYGFLECGDEFVVLTVVNDGGATFMTASTRVDDISKSAVIHGPRIDRHPFAKVPADCPPDHGNFFPPGGAAYIVLPLKSFTAGNDAMATIKLCTKDYAGGDCVTNIAYFRLPSN